MEDQYGIDYTGYGPTGVGNSPTAEEMRRQMMNRFHTDRVSQAMQFIDPYVTAQGMAAQQIVARANDPAAARRQLYGTASGQAALDFAMWQRRNGYLGSGDPIRYANNITRGVTGGGFTMAFGGSDGAGNDVFGANQRVSGQGILSEQVSMNYARGLMRDLYGGGTPDPAKLYGFDMTEASQIFATIARRGGVGEAAYQRRNADTATRLAAARDSAVDPTIRAGLAGVQAGTNEELAGIIGQTEDPKLKRELEKVLQSTDAVFVNNRGRREVARVVESVAEGLASLSDIYGELSAPELQQKLESMSGIRITNRQQAKQAHQMVESLRGAAEISGMDPRAFMQYNGVMQANLQGQVAQALGFDGRTATMSKQVTAALNASLMQDAAITSKLSQNAAKEASGLGLGDMSSSIITTDEAYETRKQGRMQFLERYKGIVMAKGGLDNLGGANRERAEEILQEFGATTDVGEREFLEREMQGIFSRAYSRPGQQRDFGAVLASRSGQSMLANAYRSSQSSAEIDALAASGLTGALNINPLANLLSAEGAAGGLGADRVASIMVKDLTLKGMSDLAHVSKDTRYTNAADRRQAQLDIMKRAGLTGGDATSFLDSFFDSETGRLIDSDSYGQFARMAGSINWEQQGTYTNQALARNKLAMIGAGDGRQRIRDSEGNVTLNSIVTALSTGKINGIQDRETMTYALQAMASAGHNLVVPMLGEDGQQITEIHGAHGETRAKMINLSKAVQSNIDLSQGMSSEAMTKLESVLGGSLNLASKLGYSSREEMFEATKNDEAKRLKMVEMLRNDPAYSGLNLRGRIGSMTAISDGAYATAKYSGMPTKLFQKLAAAQSLSGNLSDGEITALQAAIQDGEGSALGYFAASDFRNDVSEGSWFSDKDSVASMSNAGRLRDLAGRIHGAKGAGLAGFALLNENQGIAGQMDKQLKAFRTAHAAGAEYISFRDSNGDEQLVALTQEMMQNFEAAANKLREATDAQKEAQTMNEMTVTTLNVENYSPPK